MEGTVIPGQPRPPGPERTPTTSLPPTELLHRAVHAAGRALRDASVDATELDAVICVVPRHGPRLFWQSARVAHALATRNDVAAFDVPGTRAALSLASALKTSDETVRHVLVVGAEDQDRPTAVLFSP